MMSKVVAVLILLLHVVQPLQARHSPQLRRVVINNRNYVYNSCPCGLTLQDMRRLQKNDEYAKNVDKLHSKLSRAQVIQPVGSRVVMESSASDQTMEDRHEVDSRKEVRHHHHLRESYEQEKKSRVKEHLKQRLRAALKRKLEDKTDNRTRALDESLEEKENDDMESEESMESEGSGDTEESDQDDEERGRTSVGNTLDSTEMKSSKEVTTRSWRSSSKTTTKSSASSSASNSYEQSSDASSESYEAYEHETHDQVSDHIYGTKKRQRRSAVSSSSSSSSESDEMDSEPSRVSEQVRMNMVLGLHLKGFGQDGKQKDIEIKGPFQPVGPIKVNLLNDIINLASTKESDELSDLYSHYDQRAPPDVQQAFENYVEMDNKFDEAEYYYNYGDSDESSKSHKSSDSGSKAHPGEVPWQVLLEHSKVVCTAAIVNRKFIVTAASCLKELEEKSPTLNTVNVSVGAVDRCASSSSTRHFIEGFAIHPDFASFDLTTSSDTKGFVNNVAVVEVSPVLPVAGRARPVCLPRPSEWTHRLHRKVARVSGWHQDDDQHTLGCQLHYGTVQIIDNSDQRCKKMMESKKGSVNTSALMCTFDPDVTACAQDCGGPVTVTHQGVAYLAGIVNYGVNKCGHDHLVSVHTHVGSVAEWIVGQIQGGECAHDDANREERRRWENAWGSNVGGMQVFVDHMLKG